MRLKKILCMIFASVIMVSCLGVNAGAVSKQAGETELNLPRATERFNFEVSANSIKKAETTFPMEAGETITIKATYTPSSASVDFGVIAPDGYFYSLNTTSGSFDETFEIDQRGRYTFAVRNNSSNIISVSGNVNY